MSRVYSPQTDDEMFDTVSTEKNKPKMSRKLKIILIVSIISVVIIAVIVAVAVVLANKGGDETTSKPGQNPDDPNINDDPNNPSEPSDPSDPSDPEPNEPKDEGLGQGDIAAITLGTILGVILIAGGVYLVIRLVSKKKSTK